MLLEHRSSVLLLTGVRAGDALAGDLLRAAARQGFSAAVVKSHGDPIDELVDTANTVGICLLTTPDDLSWAYLDGTILTVLGARGAVDDTVRSDGDELFALANGISAQIGGSVTIEGLDKRVLAYSSSTTQRIDDTRRKGILDRLVPEPSRNAAQYLAVLASDECVRFPPTAEEYARAAISIRAGQRPLGTIWAIEGVDGLDGDGEQALIDGARLAALNMLHSHAGTRSELHRRGPALLRALEGSLTSAEIDFQLSRRGGDEIALIGFGTVGEAANGEPLISHVANVLAQHIVAYRSDASIATTARAVYVMLPAADHKSAERFVVGALNAARGSFPNQVRAGLGSTSINVDDLPRMRREVDDILRVLTIGSDGPAYASIDDVRLDVLVAHVADRAAQDPCLRHPGSEAMQRHDDRHGTAYAQSISAWIDTFGDYALAARSLAIHPNTLRYRLRRCAELFGIDISDADELLEVWLQLRVAKLEIRPGSTMHGPSG